MAKSKKAEKAVEEVVEQQKTEETVAEVAETDASVAQSVENSVENTEKAVETVAEEKIVEVKPEDLFVPDPKSKRPKTYASVKQVKSGYSDDQALNLLRKKIQSYKQVHERFLQKIEESDAFLLEKLFIPVYSGKAEVCYSWKTKNEGQEVVHKELRTVEGVFCEEMPDLDPKNFSLSDAVSVTAEKRKEELVSGKKPRSFDKSLQDLQTQIKKESPDKKAEFGKRNESYELLYVPVLKTTCTLDGDAYVGYVNLHNGESCSEYKISEKLGRAVENASLKNKLSKQSVFSSFVFSFIFAVLAFVKALYPDWDFGALTLKETWVSLVLVGASVLPLLCWCVLFGFKKKKVLAKCVKLGKLPNNILATLFSLLGWVIVIASAVLFFFKVLVA